YPTGMDPEDVVVPARPVYDSEITLLDTDQCTFILLKAQPNEIFTDSFVFTFYIKNKVESKQEAALSFEVKDLTVSGTKLFHSWSGALPSGAQTIGSFSVDLESLAEETGSAELKELNFTLAVTGDLGEVVEEGFYVWTAGEDGGFQVRRLDLRRDFKELMDEYLDLTRQYKELAEEDDAEEPDSYNAFAIAYASARLKEISETLEKTPEYNPENRTADEKAYADEVLRQAKEILAAESAEEEAGSAETEAIA
ncbi:MAG: hypothetical protein II794_05560, partial [Oscillospiraceae bacterium]|nr:hypothetical protein [Oscillospiraceae bacterium]